MILIRNSPLLSTHPTENEAELSFFNREDYEAFLADPTTKW